MSLARIARHFPSAKAGAIALVLGVAFAGFPSAAAETVAPGWTQTGVASWYGPGFHGKLTANGERFDKDAMTAAHRTLPFGTWLRVRNHANGLECVVRVNDRGPFAKDRIIDLSEAAARAIGMIASGTAVVTIVAIAPPASTVSTASTAPASTAPATTAPASTATTATPITWRIQVASYSVAANADRTVALLVSHGLSPVVERACPLYRVVLLHVPEADRERVLSLLARLGFPSPLVMRE